MAQHSPRATVRRPSSRRLQSFVIIGLVVCCLLSLSINFLHGSRMSSLHEPLHDFIKNQQEQMVMERDQPHHQLAGLDCSAYGGPSKEIAQEMVYWSDIEEDSRYQSPFFPELDEHPRYMTFEPDEGGWNNIRMSMETVLAMAHAMGRTLVLPPAARMYLLTKDKNHKKDKQRNAFSFADFFHMDSISREHEGLEIISTEEFLKREAMTGRLVDRSTGKIAFPPGNRTDWNGESRDINQVFFPWLRGVALNPKWDPDKCFAAFPASKDAKDIQFLKDTVQHIKDTGGFPSFEQYIGKPTPVDASAEERLKENNAERDQLCLYDLELQNDILLHFSGKESHSGRLLVHFYAFLFFEDWKQDLWMKRFVRDHVRYVDELQCAAARIVHALKERAALRNSTSFDGFHVRRGDFQYKETRVEASVLYDVSKDQLTPGATVYIATDEHNKSFFDPLKEHYDVVFLDDFLHLVPDLNTNYYGMLDQLVASRSRIFFGCWFSTFSSYINRLRGYMVTKLKLPGHEDGLVESYYYARKGDKMKMREFYPVKKTFHSREYPAAWRGIDKGSGLLHD